MSNKAKKNFKKKYVNGTKIFLKKKKKKAKKKAWDRYKNLSEEKKKHHHHQDWNKNTSEGEKQKILVYEKLLFSI